MTARTYDVILSVTNATSFVAGNNIIGNTTATTGIIASVDRVNNKLKVKLANLQQEFNATEFIHSNAITITGTANGFINSTAIPFQANTMSGNVTTAITQVSAIAPSAFIAEKNAFTQNPVVRLYSIYYPGEWYPPNANGNPSGTGEGYAWPSIFPIRLAELVGDKTEDLSYNVTYAGVSYVPYPLNLSGLEQASDGKVNELSLTIYNTDNIISYLVENPYLTGINNANAVYATVNGELVYGIDPRTVQTSSFVGNSAAQEAINKARASGLAYDLAIVSYYGTANAMFDKTMTDAVNGYWTRQKMDTRDLLGGAVEIKTTFANFLDYWPEYALVSSTSNNRLTMTSTLPYRVGDVVKTSTTGYSNAVIQSITSDDTINLDKPIVKYLSLSSRDTAPQGAVFRADGNKFYFVGSTNDSVYEYNLSTRWDISTANYVNQFSLAAQETDPRALQFSDTGSYMFVTGAASDSIHRYTLSTPWNVATATLTQTFSVAPYEISPTGLYITPDGSNAYVVGSTSDKVYQFTLSTPWSLSTASYTQNVTIGVQEAISSDLAFNIDGSSFYLVGSANKAIFQYTMSNAWDISTAVAVSNSSYIGTFDSSPSMLAFSAIGDIVYFGGITSDNIYQVALSVPSNISSLDYSLPIGSPIYIENPQSDTSSYLIDNYKIDQLESLGEHVATFGLVSWLQYFKIVTPKRKYYKNTCQWLYKGPECQYPGPGNSPIPGTLPVKYANSNPIALDNSVAPSLLEDKCAKSLAACTLRNNEIHFGGFPGVGRTVPQM